MISRAQCATTLSRRVATLCSGRNVALGSVARTRNLNPGRFQIVRRTLPSRAQPVGAILASNRQALHQYQDTPAVAPDVTKAHDPGSGEHAQIPRTQSPKRPAAKAPTEYPAQWEQVQQHIEDPETIVVAHVAPSVRVVVCEALGYGVGINMEKQLVRALRNLGFDYVFDTMFTADLTIIEEGHELISRIRDKMLGREESAEHPLPMFTSCCPGWIQLAEKSYPELLPHVSTCKSPQMMMGAVVKSFFAEQLNCPPEKIQVVAIMPCVRKQPEADRDVPEFHSGASYAAAHRNLPGSVVVGEYEAFSPLAQQLAAEADSDAAEDAPPSLEDCAVACETSLSPYASAELGVPRDSDHVLTTLEIAQVFEMKGIDLRVLPHSQFDMPLGLGGGAGQLFGTTGGVMEAALRTAYELITGSRLERVEFEGVRGLDAVKTATVELQPSEAGPLGAAAKKAGLHEPLQLKVAVVNGLGNAKKVAAAVRDGSMDVDFVEVMACPGGALSKGCIGGGGNPRATPDVLRQRQQALYSAEERKELRRSHDNPMIQLLYSKFLGEPGGERAHELLHTHYVPGGPPSVAEERHKKKDQ